MKNQDNVYHLSIELLETTYNKYIPLITNPEDLKGLTIEWVKSFNDGILTKYHNGDYSFSIGGELCHIHVDRVCGGSFGEDEYLSDGYEDLVELGLITQDEYDVMFARDLQKRHRNEVVMYVRSLENMGYKVKLLPGEDFNHEKLCPVQL